MIEQYRGRRVSGLLRMVTVAVMAMVFGVAGLVASAEAAVTRVGAWASDNDYTNGAAYTPGVGTNRVAIVVITAEDGATATVSATQVTLGGQQLTPISQLAPSAGQYSNYLYVGYLRQSQIAAMSGNALNITWGTAPSNPFGPPKVAFATYQSVDQSTPIVAQNANFSGTNTLTITPGNVDITTGELYFYGALGGQPGGHTADAANDMIEMIDVVGGTNDHTIAVAERNITTAATNFNPTATFGTSSRAAIIAAVLKEFPPNGTIALSSATYSVGEAGPTVTITATRTGGSTGAVGISYATSNGTAVAGTDYTATSGTLSWADGDAASKTFTVPITNDTLDEANETFTVTLSSPSGGAVLGTPASATVTITDDDPAPTVGFSAATSSGSEATLAVSIPVTLSTPSGQTVTVNYATSAGTATANVDYGTTSGTLTFLAGETAKNVPVTVINEANPEADETFSVTLSAPSNATLSTTTHTYTILNDDIAGSIQLASAAYTVTEGGPSVILIVTRTGGSAGAVGVSYATSNGTATAGSDYTATSGTLSWIAGNSANRTIVVPILEDGLSESSEVFTVTLSSPTGFAALGAPSSAEVTITDNDCSDGTPSTITISNGQTVSGSSVNLTTLFTPTGNVGSFTYTINALPVTSPWDSTAFGVGGPLTVTLGVSGTDPDCGGYAVSATNTITVNNFTGIAPGTATAVGKDESILVTAPYSGDINGNATVSIFYALCPGGVCGSAVKPGAAANTPVPVGPDSPYSYTITGLTNGLSYKVWVDYADPNGGNASQTISDVTPQNNLVHNSRVTGSAKWPTAQSGEAVAGWGIAGSKYGKFTCATCHIKNATPNIKRVRKTFTAPDATPSNFPGSAQTVLFTTTDEDAFPAGSGFGDDNTPTGRTSSNKICEVCHSITRYHRYDTTNQVADGGSLGHYNNLDCLGCHQHNQGFKASCDSCHGSPPDDAATLVKATSRPTGSTTAGAHAAHSTTLGIDCAQCHYGSVGSGARHNVDGAVTLGFVDLPSGTGGSDAGSYTGQNVGGGKVVYNSNDAGTTVKNNGDVGFGTRTCANYCHGSTIVDGSAKSPVWDGGSPIACGTCHRGSNADMDNASALGSHRTHAGATRENLACTACHGAAAGNLKIAGSDATNHVDGTATWDVSGLSKHYSSASNPDYKTSPTGSTGALAPTAPASYGSCRNLACHWGTETPKWGVGPATCTTCHRGAGGDTGLLKDSAPASGSHADHAYASDTYVDCDDCHGAGAITGTHAGHLDNATNFAGRLTPGTNFTDNGGRANTNDTCAVICHKNATWGASSDAGSITWTLETTACDGVAVGAPVVNYCLDCHASTYTGQAGPAVVTSAFVGTHLNAKSPDETMSCLAERRNQCLECHVMHDGTQSTSAVWIPIPGTAGEQAVLGLDYTGAKHFNAINLKKTIPSSGTGAVTAGTEAQICWGCHDSTRNSGTVQSEWGVNNNTSTGSITYDYGDLYTTLGGSTKTSNWTTGYWSSGNGRLSSDLFWYKRGAVQSIHAVDPNATRPGLDAVANIRCSYCHDVHDLNKASGDAVTGQPYLRGTWKGNPYREDGAPHSSTTYPDLSPYGRVPRGERANTELGGYQIDQNNANPTATWTLVNSAGLCTLCHGSNVNTMNKFDTNEAGAAETTAQSWVGTNGHSAAVLGGTNTVAANIFTNSNRGSQNRVGLDPDVTNGPMAYQGGAGGDGPGDTDNAPITRGTRMGGAGAPDAGGYGLQPYVFNHTSEFNRRAGYDWGATIDNATTQNDYHSFSCSKCHNPHASRLPRLMITNCLDTSHNTWDDDNGNPSTISGSNAGTQLSDATTAQNCHRRATQGGMGAGWNNVTPW